MKAVFIELPAFERHRDRYFDEEGFRRLQEMLMARPEAGDLMEGTGGLRKMRCSDARRGAARANEEACASFITTGRAAQSSGCSHCMTRTKWPT